MAITATRVMQRFFEDSVYEGSVEYHWEETDILDFDTPAELIGAIRRDYVTFESTGSDWASYPDGSQIIDYATAEREEVSWHPAVTIGDATLIFVIAFVDAPTFREFG